MANLHDKSKYVIHIRNLKQVSNNGFVLKKVHRVIPFNQSAWLKPYIEVNTDLRKKAKKVIVKKSFLSWWIRKFLEKLRKMWENTDIWVLVWLKYGEKSKLFYMDTDGFTVYIKAGYIFKDITEDIETRFDASNYELGRPLAKGKNKKMD